jgi:hypothetical protein
MIFWPPELHSGFENNYALWDFLLVKIVYL